MSDSKHFLLIEDNDQYTALLLDHLRQAGFRTTHSRVKSREELAEVLNNSNWDCILFDCALPNLTGLEALQLFKQTGIEIPFIVICDTASEDDALEMMNAGAHDYVLKGNLKRLVPAMRRELAKAQWRCEQRQLEMDLRFMNERHRLFSEVTSDFLFINRIESNGRLTLEWVSDSFTRITGYTQNELAELGWPAVIDLEYKDIYLANIRRLLKGETATFEVRIIHKNGQRQWIRTYNHPFWDKEQKRVEWIYGSAQNINEQKFAEQALKLSELQFHSVWENSLDGMRLIDENGMTISVNESYCRMVEKTKTELEGKPFTVVYDEHLQEEFLKIGIRQFAERTVEPHWEREVTFAGNKKFWCELINTFIEFEKGKPLLLSIFRNFTKRKLAEDALRQSELQFRLIWENSFDGMRVTDENGTTLFVNDAYCRLTKKSKEELEGKPFTIIYDAQIQEQTLKRGIARFAKRTIESHLERELTLWNGEKKWLELSNSFIELDTGKPLILSIFRDITERKQAEEQVRLNDVRLESLLRISQYKAATNQDLLEYALEEAVCLTGSKIGYILYYYANRQELVLNAWSKEAIAECQVLEKQTVYQLEKTGLWGEVVRQRKPIIVNDFQATNPLKKSQPDGHVRLFRFMSIPVLVDDNIVATVGVGNKTGEYNQSDVQQLTLLMDAVWKIIERRKAEDALRESEERYRRLVEHNPLPIAIHVAGKIVYINDAGVQLIRAANKEEIIGKNAMDFVHPDYKELVIERIKLTQQEGKLAEPIEEKFLCSDGKIVDVEVTGFPIIFDRMPATQVVILDVTQRKRVEEALQKERILMRTVIDNLPDAIYVKDLEGKKTLTNRADIENMGLTNESDAIGKTDYELFPGEIAEKLSADDREVLDSGQPLLNQEERLVKANGEERWLLTSKLPLRDENGGIVGLVGIGHDLTPRKQNEEAISRLAAVVEQTSESIVITDLDACITYVNPAFERISGYSRAEAIGQNPRLLKSGQQDAAFYQKLWEILLAGKPWTGQFINRKKDGSLYYEQAVIFPIKNKDGKIISYATVKRDITDERKMQEQILQSQKLDSLGQLTGGVAHDFNNILTVINGYAQLLLMDIESNNPHYQQIMQIQNAGERAANLTSQLLAFSRKQIISPQILHLNHVIEGLSKMLKRLIGEDIEIDSIPSPAVTSILADPAQIEQIIINLLVNARDAIYATSERTVPGRITIETSLVYLDEEYVKNHIGSKPGAHVLLSVSDNGIGMDESIRSKIFEPFFTTKGLGKGTGLGLATVYGVVKQNNGSIYVYSEPGLGTTFKIYWPCAVQESMDISSAESAQQTLRGSGTILVVEDEDAVRSFISEALTALGYQIIAAANGEDAIRVFRQSPLKIDLVITDVIMPGMNGRELANQLSQINPSLKIIFASGYTDDHIVRTGVLDKDVDFIQKPYSIGQLSRKVREVLKEKT